MTEFLEWIEENTNIVTAGQTQRLNQCVDPDTRPKEINIMGRSMNINSNDISTSDYSDLIAFYESQLQSYGVEDLSNYQDHSYNYDNYGGLDIAGDYKDYSHESSHDSGVAANNLKNPYHDDVNVETAYQAYDGAQDWSDYDEIEEYTDEEVAAYMKAQAEAEAARKMAESIMGRSMSVVENQAPETEAPPTAKPFKLSRNMNIIAQGCTNIFDDPDIVIDHRQTGDDQDPWAYAEDTMVMDKARHDFSIVCTSPKYNDKCRLAPASTGRCEYKGLGISRSMLVAEKIGVDENSGADLWSEPMHTMLFRCGFDKSVNKTRWQRLQFGGQKLGPKRPSSYGKFKILCGPPPCSHPSVWSGDYFALNRADDLHDEKVDLNVSRNGKWICYDKDGNILPGDAPDVPPGGRCKLACDTNGFPDVLQPTKEIVCDNGMNANPIYHWNQHRLAVLNKQLNLPKYFNQALKNLNWLQKKEIWSGTKGWKCYPEQ